MINLIDAIPAPTSTPPPDVDQPLVSALDREEAWARISEARR